MSTKEIAQFSTRLDPPKVKYSTAELQRQNTVEFETSSNVEWNKDGQYILPFSRRIINLSQSPSSTIAKQHVSYSKMNSTPIFKTSAKNITSKQLNGTDIIITMNRRLYDKNDYRCHCVHEDEFDPFEDESDLESEMIDGETAVATSEERGMHNKAADDLQTFLWLHQGFEEPENFKFF